MKPRLLSSLAFALIFAGCVANQPGRRIQFASVPDPNNTNLWSTNVWIAPPVPSHPVNSNLPYIVAISMTARGNGDEHHPTLAHDFVAFVGGMDSNHVYAVSNSSTPSGPWVLTMKVPGWTAGVMITNTTTGDTTNQFYKVGPNPEPGFLIWTNYTGTGGILYTIYSKPGTNFGWTPTNTAPVTDVAGGASSVQYFGAFGDNSNAAVSVTVPFPAPSPAYQFAAYFPASYPHVPYPLWLGNGWNP